MAEYDRYLAQDSRGDFKRRNSILEALHLDGWLLLLLGTLISFGLFVLFSASDGSQDALVNPLKKASYNSLPMNFIA